jgi:hypothetical protein
MIAKQIRHYLSDWSDVHDAHVCDDVRDAPRDDVRDDAHVRDDVRDARVFPQFQNY